MSNKIWKSFSIVLHVLFEEIEIQQKMFSQNMFSEAFANLDNVELVNILIENTEIDVSANYNDAIQLASKYGQIAVVNRLLRDGTGRVDPSVNNNSAIRSILR